MNQTTNLNPTMPEPETPEVRDKIALLELSPHAVKLIFAWYTPNVSFEIFDEFYEPLKIHQDIERDGFIKPTQIANTIKIVKMFRRMCDSMKIHKAVAYATSAMRDAKNYYGFIEELEITSGFKLRLMSEQDEVSDYYNGVINSMDISRGIIISIEEDRTRLIRYVRKSVIAYSIIPFGAETLATLFITEGQNTEEQCASIYDFFLKQLKEIDWLNELQEDEVRFVGIGEVLLNITKIIRKGRKYPLDMPHNFIANDVDFDNVFNAIKGLDLGKNTKLKGISNMSTSMIASGLSIIRAIRDFLKISHITMSTSTLATGVLFNQCVPMTSEKPISDILLYSLESNLRYYSNNAKNGPHVYELCTMLFRQLRVMHKLSRQHIRALKIASYMYDAGSRIRYQSSRKDAFPVIINTQLYGASHRDLVMAAFTALSQNNDEFSLSEWVKFKDIVDDEDLQAVKKLAVILRIAVGLDRAQQAHVKDVVCDVLGDSVIMKTIAEADITFEIKCAMEAGVDFKKVFGKNLELL